MNIDTKINYWWLQHYSALLGNTNPGGEGDGHAVQLVAVLSKVDPPQDVLSLCSGCGQTDKAGLLDHGLGGNEADVTLGQHLLGEADLAGAVEDGVAQNLGLSHLAGVADLEGAAWAPGAHGFLVGEPLDGRGGQGGALLDGTVRPVGVGHGEEGGVDTL